MSYRVRHACTSACTLYFYVVGYPWSSLIHLLAWRYSVAQTEIEDWLGNPSPIFWPNNLTCKAAGRFVVLAAHFKPLMEDEARHTTCPGYISSKSDSLRDSPSFLPFGTKPSGEGIVQDRSHQGASFQIWKHPLPTALTDLHYYKTIRMVNSHKSSTPLIRLFHN